MRHQPRLMIAFGLWSLVFLALVGNPPALAAVGDASEDIDSLRTLLEAAQKDGYRVVFVPPETASPVATTSGDVLSAGKFVQNRAIAARDRLLAVLADVPAFPSQVAGATARFDPGIGSFWPVLAIGLAGLYLLIGAGARRVVETWGRAHFMYLFNPVPTDRAERILYLGLRAFLRTLGLLVQLAVAGLLVVLVDYGGTPVRITGTIVLLWAGFASFMIIMFQAIFAPDVPSHRLIKLDDAAAIGLKNSFLVATGIAAIGGAICTWLAMANVGHDTHVLSLIGATLVTAILFSRLAVRYRREIAGAILGHSPATAALWRQMIARIWHVLAVAYLMLAWAVAAVRLLLDLPNPIGLVAGPILAGIAGLSFYALALLAIDKWFERRNSRSAASEDVTTSSGGMKGLAEHAAALLGLAGVVLFIVDIWRTNGIDDDSGFSGLAEIVLVGFIAYLGFQAVKIAIDTKIAEETGDMVEAEPGDEGGATGASRLATLLPIFRGFLLGVIVVIAGMVILSELGIDIAPLFAGAGVIGLAVGFGSQALIRDMFSGAFFLIDDAFRRGEYINLGTVKGTVEKISIRSMQLRHHLGPLHTIPFGEIQQLTNYSRDWVMMKLPLRVTYDTDVDKVRKLIKNLGQELMEHPEIGANFLEPLKSQGVFKMEDSAMIIRVKFMTKPGDQFTVRKLVYSRIREVFAENGIKFAHKEVTVRVADSGTGKPLGDAEKTAVAGAVAPLLEEAGSTATSGEDR